MPIGVVAGRYWILRKGVEDVGEDELLMLLLVMEADLEDAHGLGQLRIVGAGEQALHSRVDMGAKRITPRGPRIGRRCSWDCCGITFVTAATKDG